MQSWMPSESSMAWARLSSPSAMSWSARVTLNDSEGAVGVRSASRRLLSHACEVSLRHFWTRGVMSSAVRQSLKRCETMSAAWPRLPPLVGVRRMMASKARNHFKALASSSSVPELAASSICATARRVVDLCVRVAGNAGVRHVEEHRVWIHGALEDGEVVDGVPAHEGVAWGRAWWRRLRLLLLVPLVAVSLSILFSPHARGLVVRCLTSCFMMLVCPRWPGGVRRCAASGSRSGGRPLRCCGWRRRRRLLAAPSRWGACAFTGACAFHRWPPRRQRVHHDVLGRLPRCRGREC